MSVDYDHPYILFVYSRFWLLVVVLALRMFVVGGVVKYICVAL